MNSAEFTILIDGDCPLCAREAAFLRRLDAGRGRLELIDIAGENFDAARFGRSHETLMARIHGVLPDGSVIEGVEVFRRGYAAVGRGWVLSWTRLPGLRLLADAGYRWFARNRLRWTGRGDACSAIAKGGKSMDRERPHHLDHASAPAPRVAP
jgi:predicted DCC family thiol-disulfide oxidoreductase YuxK